MPIKILKHRKTIDIVIIKANIIHKITPFIKPERSLSLFFAPNSLAKGIANPLQIPMQKPNTRKFIEPVAPTAASACPPNVLPTIAASIILYSC